jgi:5-hydroxyisourate hydrolase
MGISTHILDTSFGRPATGVPLSLSRWRHDQWLRLADHQTDADGRCVQLLPMGTALEAGRYRIRFDTAAYYETQRLAGLYPHVDIVFEVRDAQQHYHIPLLLTANGYTTYRGS